ncbi:carbohydrate ABC transporter permease [Chelatococcus asaccharovorans]|uniref:carbohydrate ABC transporter permease n=1 Tax=Chelatococcus asaccharovorans TaxID=28210 RepID=UPI00224C64C2|nr:sugar ABC transporter permease [Chelatococcus asaccharovorans]CAH1650693.1 Carbohydrate ABC transporter membrane protein 1 (CUT1 family) [Chelatococcus asaccharovorans]CAH1692470.1 Carbohydrate ABC transporter membrane protein 1 (CUT1 family) [Chelatococcus asaccharovorans]
MRGDRLFITVMLGPALIFLALFYLWPMVENLRVSFTDLTLLRLRVGGQWIGLANYEEFITSPETGRLMMNTFIWLTAISVAVRLLLGLAIALIVNTPLVRHLRLATLARIAILVPWATPPVVAIIIWRWLLEAPNGALNSVLLALGIIDTPIAFLADLRTVWPSVIAIVVWNTVPLIALSLLASLQAVPADLYEAAELDGATRSAKFWHITLPFLKPTIVVLGLTSVFWTFNNFVYVWLATGAGPGTFTNVLATEIYIRSFVDFRLGYGAAIGIVMALIMAVFGYFYFRMIGRRQIEEVL